MSLKHVLLLGRPGSGKGTVAKKLIRDFNFVHLSTGDLLRAELQAKTKLGTEASRYMTAGQLVPDEIVVGMVQNYMDKRRGAATQHLLLDGFPRKLSQAKSMSAFGMTVDLVVALDVPVETIVDRISKRWVHSKSGRIYNLDYSPPRVAGKDDVTGEALTQRADDQPEVVKRRLEDFDSENESIVSHYSSSNNTLLKRFAGTQTDVIYPELKKWVGSQL